jgi:hypothetical protein
VVRVSDQPVGRIQQTKVHPPGIQSDSRQCAARRTSGYTQTILNLRPEPQDIPVNMVSHTHGSVRETMNFI